MLAKYLKLGDSVVEELQGQSDRQSPTEQTLRAWQPHSGTDVRKVLWKTLNAMGRTDAADVIIPLEEINQTSRQRAPLVSQTSRRSETDSSYISASPPQRKQLDQLSNGEGSPRRPRVRLSLPCQLSPGQPAEDENRRVITEKRNSYYTRRPDRENYMDEKSDDSGNDSTEVNFDGKAETERPSARPLRDQSESNTPKLRQGEKIPRSIRQYRTKSNQEYTRPLTPVPPAPGAGASSPPQLKKKQRHQTADAPQTERRPPKANTNPARKGIIGSARSEHSFVDSRRRKRSREGRAYTVAGGSFTATSDEEAVVSEAAFPGVLETFL